MTHESVLLFEALDILSLKEGDVFLDATLGSAGHSSLACDRLGGRGTIIGLDVDGAALERSRLRMKEKNCLFLPVKSSFRQLDEVVKNLGVGPTKVLFDLGLSSDQLESSGRGFSFQRDEPLLMTFDDEARFGVDLTARDVVNKFTEEELTEIFRQYGEERFAKRIARAIREAREKAPIETSGQLASLVASSVPGRRRFGGHPATKVFQAIRIKVNDELGALTIGLRKAFEILPARGRIAVISFHSLEDRIVKNMFRDWAGLGRGKVLTKKPIIASAAEVKRNPRARSAKLRAIEKIK
jgi:16S rRNA (cytosine1402-N4)-methyltransferase